MKIAIGTQTGDIDALVDPRFGRARWFVVVLTGSGEWTVMDNIARADAPAGAGAQASAAVLALGVNAVVTGNVGPTATKALSKGGIHIYLAGNGVSAREALEALARGELPEAIAPTVAGHWA